MKLSTSFFSQDPVWNERYKRFETYSETHGLYWFWRDDHKKASYGNFLFQTLIDGFSTVKIIFFNMLVLYFFSSGID
jgi:hypothetical protein